MSHTSRSYQLAAGQMSVMLGKREPVLRKSHLDAHIFVALEGKQMIDDRKIARRLALTMCPHALIDGGEVVEHLVWPVHLFFEKAEETGKAVFRHPKRGYVIERVLRHGRQRPAGR